LLVFLLPLLDMAGLVENDKRDTGIRMKKEETLLLAILIKQDRFANFACVRYCNLPEIRRIRIISDLFRPSANT
jgi:hypothetical protein